VAIKRAIENFCQTIPWLLGISQERGEVYSIISLENIIKTILNKKTHTTPLGADDRLVYLQPYLNARVGLIVKDFKLEHFTELPKIFEIEFSGEGEIHKNLNSVSLKEFALNGDFNYIENSFLNVLTESNDLAGGLQNNFKHLENLSISPIGNLVVFIKDIYLDTHKKRPVFVLNTEGLINYILTLKPN